MKRIYIWVLLLIGGTSMMAQQSVRLKINHLLGSVPFQTSTQSTNNLGNNFDLSRLQYYIAEITLVHDGGIESTVPDTWVLVDANQTVDQALGSFSITTLEAIKFGIGVQQSYNHLDPSSYAMGHPLAPQTPSMHWGWTSGYRFVCMEGRAGANFSQSFEIHALEDANYFTVNVSTAGTMVGQDLVVELDANYAEALRDIDVSTGPINHGGQGISITLLQNYRDHVFTKALALGATPAANSIVTFDAFPNPTSGTLKLRLDGKAPSEMSYVIYDALGRKVNEVVPAVSSLTEVNLPAAGQYFVALYSGGNALVTKHVIVAR